MVFKALFEQMDKLEDLLPGIEDFLCSVLAKESLTPEAEEQRQYFVERLDIIKLPPSVPPRPHAVGLKLYPISNGTMPDQSSSNNNNNNNNSGTQEPDDFAAHQRELSRALVAKGNKSSTGSGEEVVKVYDDIDSKDLSGNDESQCQIEDEDSMYEIPKIKRNLSDSGYEKAVDRSSLSNICESTHSDTEVPHVPAVPQPPPLPPRRERTSSNAASRSSIASILEEKLADLNLNPKLDQETALSHGGKQTDSKSEKMTDGVLDDYADEVDAASVDSMDLDGGVKLPRVMKKKRHHHRVTHSFSAPLCDISNSFCDLEDVMLSGELYYKSTLLSTKNMVALSPSSLVCYKFDKTDCKPVLVIPLTGYRATFHKRHSRQSYEIQLSHDELDDHSFLTYFKEWAQTWCEYINCIADGRKVTGPHYSLVRNRNSMEPAYSSTYDLTKASAGIFGSSQSVCSYDGLDPTTGKHKKRHSSGNRQRIGSIVSRASQILDNFKLLKKSTSSAGQHYEDQHKNIPEDTTNETVVAYDDVNDTANAKNCDKSNSLTKANAKNSYESSNLSKLKTRSSSVDKIGTRTGPNSKQRSKSDVVKKTESMKKLSIPETRGKLSGSSMSSWSEKGSISEPRSPMTPESGVFESSVIEMPTEVPKVFKHQGFLNIYSSFNKRKWGKRWCKVLENNFECYRNQSTTVCELEFLLRGCVLRRAVDETKSELGLMLMENNREKITVEPMSWSELGSWLRILMKETSTPKPPEGLEGYMEEANEYHDIMDDTKDLETSSRVDQKFSGGRNSYSSKMAVDSKNTKNSSSWNSNRDSGNCSGESVDSRSDGLDKSGLHPEFSDSSLPRVSAHKTGDIYTQVRKSSSASIFENQKETEGKSRASRSKSEGRYNTHSNKVPRADDSSSIDFDAAEDNLFILEHERSMVDEVMSKFTSQISGCFDEMDVEQDHEYEEFENVVKPANTFSQSFIEREHIYVDIDSCRKENTFIEHRRLSRDLTEIDVISPIKETIELDSSDISKHQNFLCSSFVDDEQGDNSVSKGTKIQDVTKTNQRQSEKSIPTHTENGSMADNSDHKSAIDETFDNISYEIPSSMRNCHKNTKAENSSRTRSELCVEDLAHVLSNLSLEDKDHENTENKGPVGQFNDNTKNSDLTEKEKGIMDKAEKDKIDNMNEGQNKIDNLIVEASCDNNDKVVPFEPELPNLLDDDVRTRRSVVMREIAEAGGDIDRTLKELRTKLVQLKKDRISIHDRMLISSNNSQVHKYLEDEYNRLNREVEKVNGEIACLEELERESTDRENRMVKKTKEICEEEEEMEEIDV